AAVSDLPGARRGDGLPPRARLPDARRRGEPARPHPDDGAASGPLPRLSRLRDGVPLRGAVRPAPGGHARAARATWRRAGRARLGHPAIPPPGLPVPGTARRTAPRAPLLSAVRAPGPRPRPGAAGALPDAARHGGAAAHAASGGRAAARGGPGPWRPYARARGCAARLRPALLLSGRQ